MKKILILNGPNLNLQGKRDVNIYGTTTFEEYTESLAKRYEGTVEFDYFQSNIEGELINAIHASVGKYLAEKGVDRLFTVGRSGELIAKAALGAGMSKESVTAFDEELGAAAIAEKIKENIAVGDAILFKASRAMKFEELIKAIFND